MSRVLMAMSGGVDSSVAAGLLAAEGHEVVGVTMRLWGGESDTGCCSVADVDDARRSADALGVEHLVFNFSDEFDRQVVAPYVAAHAAGVTPNPCIECNRSLKFDRLLERADDLGFDFVATGHHARIGTRTTDDGSSRLTLERGADRAKDQSYVVHMLDQQALARTLFPIGHLTKPAVRALAAELGLRTATKPDSQDVCFITSTGGRAEFLGRRIPFHPAPVVDRSGTQLGEVAAVELVTVGQRRGIGLAGGGPKRFVLDVTVDGDRSAVVVGDEADLLDDELVVTATTWVDGVESGEVLVQASAHGTPQPATVELLDGDRRRVAVRWRRPQRRIAAGQSVVFYDPTDTRVLGGGINAAQPAAVPSPAAAAARTTAPGRVGETT